MRFYFHDDDDEQCDTTVKLWQGPSYGSAPISRAVLDEITDLVNAGLVQPIVDRVFDIGQADHAAHLASRGDTIGKIIISFRYN